METRWRKYERDIDVFLAEEFSVSADFCRWFLSSVSKESFDSFKMVEIEVSKVEAEGESDLVVVFEHAETKIRKAALIENKIDATLQHDQAARYYRRGNQSVKRGEFQEFIVVLCAPQLYVDASNAASGFNNFISYESISAFLSTNCDSIRSQYRASFIATAADRANTAWVRVIDEATELYWKVAHKIASMRYPILEMKQRKLTKDSRWILFRPTGVSSQVSIDLKGAQGVADLTFKNTQSELLASAIEDYLDTDMTIVQVRKSSSIRLIGVPLTITEISPDVISDIDKMLSLCARLVKFYKSHTPIFRKLEDRRDADSGA